MFMCYWMSYEQKSVCQVQFVYIPPTERTHAAAIKTHSMTAQRRRRIVLRAALHICVHCCSNDTARHLHASLSLLTPHCERLEIRAALPSPKIIAVCLCFFFFFRALWLHGRFWMRLACASFALVLSSFARMKVEHFVTHKVIETCLWTIRSLRHGHEVVR